MSLKLTNFNETPPNQWKYMVPETNQWVPDARKTGSPTTPAYFDLLDMVRAHYKANQISVPADLEELVQDQCCRSIPGSFCIDEKGRRRSALGKFMFDVHAVIQGTLTLGHYKLSGRSNESNEEIERRSRICGICAFNQTPAGCSSCNSSSLTNAIQSVIGVQSLSTDSLLKSCTICGCSLVAKTRLPKDILLSHMSEDQINELPAHCWLK